MWTCWLKFDLADGFILSLICGKYSCCVLLDLKVFFFKLYIYDICFNVYLLHNNHFTCAFLRHQKKKKKTIPKYSTHGVTQPPLAFNISLRLDFCLFVKLQENLLRWRCLQIFQPLSGELEVNCPFKSCGALTSAARSGGSSPHSWSGVATWQILHDASEELLAQFGPLPVTHSQHGLEDGAGSCICHAHWKQVSREM